MTSHITKVHFSLIGDDSIKANSFITVTSPDSFKNNVPLPDGIYDPHLGTIDNSYNCKTCRNPMMSCFGHDGMINLNYPILSPICLKEIKKWLKVLCIRCGSILFDDAKVLSYPADTRLTSLSALSKAQYTTCPHCGFDNNPLSVTTEKGDKTDMLIQFVYANTPANLEDLDGATPTSSDVIPPSYVYPHQIKRIFDKVTDETVMKLGKNIKSHPRKFVLSHIKIPSTVIRPDERKVGSVNNADSNKISPLLFQIVKKNIKMMDITPSTINDASYVTHVVSLNTLYSSLIGAGVKSESAVTDNAFKSILDQLKSHNGFYRRFVLGRRTSLCARSLIIGDRMVPIGYIIMPLKFAKKMTVKVTVQPYNYDEMLVYYNNGSATYPGATIVERKSTGTTYMVDAINKKVPLEYGDVLYRHCIDGDDVTFNRQPSLMRSNILGHKVLICTDPNKLAIVMNNIACPWYHADFDGDAMNIWGYMNPGARVEIDMISNARNFIISDNDRVPMIGESEDALVGTFELTKTATRLDKYHALLLFGNCNFLPSVENKIYSGRDIISMLLADTPINYEGKTSYYNPQYAPYIHYDKDDIMVTIRKGKLVSGVLDKKAIGAEVPNSIFHIIHNEYGPKRAMDAIFNLQQIGIEFVYQRGFSMGVADVLLTPNAYQQVQVIESAIIDEALQITRDLDARRITPPIGKTIAEFYESQQQTTLSVMDDFAEPVLSSINPNTNGLFKMMISGSKGKVEHLYQIMGSLGQAILNTGRPILNLAHGRLLPYYPRFDTSPAARGYATNSFIKGITMTEWAVRSMTARYTFIVKALFTAVTGDKNRKSIKSMETCITNYFRATVIDANVIQFVYGDDYMDSRRLESVVFPTVMLTNAEFDATYNTIKRLEAAGIAIPPAARSALEGEYTRIANDRQFYRDTYIKYEYYSMYNRLMSNTKFMPININRIINNVLITADDSRPFKTLQTFTISSDGKTMDNGQPIDLKAVSDMIMEVEYAISQLPYTFTNETYRQANGRLPAYMVASTRMMGILMRSYLNSKLFLGITKESLTQILLLIQERYATAMIQYGTAVGIIAAQAFSEPLTQYMLNATRGTGSSKSADMNKTVELFGANSEALRNRERVPGRSHTVKKPTSRHVVGKMHVYLLEQYNDKAFIQEIANNLEVIKFDTLVSKVQLFYEKFGSPTHPAYASEALIVGEFLRLNPLLKPFNDLVDWCVRIELNIMTMIIKNLSIENIVNKLKSVMPTLYIVYTPENSKKLVMRIYVRATHFKKTVTDLMMEDFIDGLLDVTIRGVDNIIAAKVVPIIKNRINADGSITRITDSYMIETVGSNLRSMLCNKYVDTTRLSSSSLIETYHVFGIEEAYRKIIDEMRSIGEVDIDHRHYSIYADTMTFTGRVSSIDVSGVDAREPSNVLLKAGFEAPTKTLIKAAINCTANNLYGLTDSLMVGRAPKQGTLYADYLVDERVVKANVGTSASILDNL